MPATYFSTSLTSNVLQWIGKLASILAFLFLPELMAKAQISAEREPYMTWDEFLAEYAEHNSVYEDNSDPMFTVFDHLDQCHDHPINLNTATRADLLELQFLSEAETDSLLTYRQRHRCFYTLGELQLISGLTPSKRRWLSLFAYVGDTVAVSTTLHDRFLAGRHELSARLDIPFYLRSGQRSHPQDELLKYPNRIYLGNALSNTVRYRYTHSHDVAYGVTLQKDAGEPFGSWNNYPYDYVSAYFHAKASNRANGNTWFYWIGDYDVRAAQGLLMGRNAFGGRISLVENMAGLSTTVRPHTSSAESGYMRGGAGEFRHDPWTVTTFFSWMRPDGRLHGDTIITIYTDGLHRTQGELERRHTFTQLTGGLRLQYRTATDLLGTTLVYDHFSREIWPPVRIYNQYYLRGRSAGGLSVDYSMLRRCWQVQTELTTDMSLHPALMATMRYDPGNVAITLQLRHFSPRYVAPHANTVSQQDRVQNESGVLLGLTMQPFTRLRVTAYADLFRLPGPAFRASRAGSKGLEAYVSGTYRLTQHFDLLIYLRGKTRQQDITGYAGTLQYVTTHRLRIALIYHNLTTLTLHTALDGTASGSQTSRTALGLMASGRAVWQLSARCNVAAFAALFFTDNYASRLYAYQPQLRYAGSFPSFAYHGTSAVAMVNWHVFPQFTISARYSLLHYFNRSHIGTYTQQINASSQNDLSLQLIWRR